MNEWSVIAYGAFGLSAAASLVQFANWLLRADPQTVFDAARWSLRGLGIAAAGAVLWLALNGRWSSAMMLAAFAMPAVVRTAPRWRTLLARLSAWKRRSAAAGRGFAGYRGGSRGPVDADLAEQAATVLRAYLAQTARLAAAQPARLSAVEAFEVLGLAPGAPADEIAEAYRRLRERVDPAQGGTGWLADRIDEARDVLLGR